MGTLSLSAASITYLTVSIFKVLIAATPNLFSVAYVKISFTFALPTPINYKFLAHEHYQNEFPNI